METIADRLRQLMTEQSLSQYRLWKTSGVSQPTIKRILDGESKEPDKSTVDKLATALKTTSGWLYDGAGSREQSNIADIPARPITAWNDETELGDGYVTLPRLTIEASCGNGRLVWHIEEKGQRQAFRKSWCERLGINPAQAATIVASGDSMNDRIQDGDSLVIDPTQQAILDGKVYVLTYQDEWFIKRIFKRPGGGGLRIVSDNQDKVRYPDWDISPDDAEQLQIIGRVMGISGGI